MRAAIIAKNATPAIGSAIWKSLRLVMATVADCGESTGDEVGVVDVCVLESPEDTVAVEAGAVFNDAGTSVAVC